MANWEENCLEVYLSSLRQFLKGQKYTETELQTMLDKLADVTDTFLTASMSVFIKALHSDTEGFTAENLSDQAVEFRYLFEFTNVIRDVHAEKRTQRERMEQYGGSATFKVSD